MRKCLSLHHIAECCGICHVTVCEEPDNQLSVNILWKGEHDVLADETVLCAPSCKAVHDLLISKGIELALADSVCSQMSLSFQC